MSFVFSSWPANRLRKPATNIEKGRGSPEQKTCSATWQEAGGGTHNNLSGSLGNSVDNILIKASGQDQLFHIQVRLRKQSLFTAFLQKTSGSSHQHGTVRMKQRQ